MPHTGDNQVPSLGIVVTSISTLSVTCGTSPEAPAISTVYDPGSRGNERW